MVMAATGCNFVTLDGEGEFGRPIALATGDTSKLPRLVHRSEPCPGQAGGCSEICVGPPDTCAPDACAPVLIDSGTAITFLASDAPNTRPDRTCIELRSGAQVLAPEADDTIRAAAISRFRFDRVPLLEIPADPTTTADPPTWGWRTGTPGNRAYVSGVIGGNLLREFAVRFIHRSGQGSEDANFQIAFYREFPGSEAVLADQGRAFLPLQFPGLLLGKDITDSCLAGGSDCDYMTPFDRQRVASALRPTRMVIDACVGVPPATVEWLPDSERCRMAPGPGSAAGFYASPTGAKGEQAENPRNCVVTPAPFDATDLRRGRDASLVVATGVPGLILFEDSARRMFNDLALPPCFNPSGLGSSEPLTATACILGRVAGLDLPGWPSVGSAEAPLLQLRVRSLGLVPGLPQSAGPSACHRLESRVRGLKAQCDQAAAGRGPRLATDNNCATASDDSAAFLGETQVRVTQAGLPAPNPGRWIPTLVIPEDHPYVAAIRRDTNPEALQPDGLIGTALFNDTEVVLDYTDGSPGLRLSCFEPEFGTCKAMPRCTAARDLDLDEPLPACCFGLPEDLLIHLIDNEGEYACCAALAASTAAELNLQAIGEGREPPCPAG